MIRMKKESTFLSRLNKPMLSLLRASASVILRVEFIVQSFNCLFPSYKEQSPSYDSGRMNVSNCLSSMGLGGHCPAMAEYFKGFF